MIFFTSDTHFFHGNIMRHCKRPFASLEDMNRSMVGAWNRVVAPEDTVYHLGDFAWNAAPSVVRSLLRSLNGRRKILIRGNHDKSVKWMLEAGFDEVHKSLSLMGRLLVHAPAPAHLGCSFVLCGHVHGNWKRIGNVVNVGVDVWGYEPVSFDQLFRAEQSDPSYQCLVCGLRVRHLHPEDHGIPCKLTTGS